MRKHLSFMLGSLALMAASGAMAANVRSTSDQSFVADVLSSQNPVVLDFYATWCRPCKRMAPVVDGLAAQYAGKISVFRVDVDQNPTLTRRYHITSIPTILFLKRGRVIDGSIGIISQQLLANKVNQAMGFYPIQSRTSSPPLKPNEAPTSKPAPTDQAHPVQTQRLYKHQ